MTNNNWKPTERYYKSIDMVKQIYHIININCKDYTMTTCFKKYVHVTKEYSKEEFDFQFLQHWKSDDCGNNWYQVD